MTERSAASIDMPPICGFNPALSTGFFPHAKSLKMREIARMQDDRWPEFFRRIRPVMAAKKLSPRKTSMNAKLGPDYLRDLVRRTSVPKHANIAAIARVLDLPPDYLWEAISQDAEQPALQPELSLKTVYIKGAVQAGVWQEALEWDPTDWIPITVPADPQSRAQRFGLLVRGRSMDRLYPDGTIVIAVSLGDLARHPRPGERVVVLRRMAGNGAYEATLKEYEVDRQGRHVLWPRSSDPEFQMPIVLSGPDLPLGSVTDMDGHASTSATDHDAGEPDIRVVAVVVGSYRPEPGSQ